MKAPKPLEVFQAPWKAMGVPKGPMDTMQSIGWTALPFAAPFVGGAMGAGMQRAPQMVRAFDQEDESSPFSVLRQLGIG